MYLKVVTPVLKCQVNTNLHVEKLETQREVLMRLWVSESQALRIPGETEWILNLYISRGDYSVKGYTVLREI